MKTVSMQFRYTEEEYVAAVRLYLLRQPNQLLRIAACLFLIFLGILFLAVVGEFPTTVFLLSMAAVVVSLAISIFFLLPHQRFRSDPKYRDEYRLEFTEEGIHFQTPHINAMLDWSLYTKVFENERFYVLEYGKGMISVLPKRALRGPHQSELLKEMLWRKLGYDGSKRLKASGDAQPVYAPPAEPPDWR